MNPIAELHQRIDALDAELASESARLGRPVTCQGKGCCACCYEPVYCSSEEVHYIVEGLTNEQRAAVTKRLKLALDKVKTFGLFEVEMPPVMDWLKMALPCPFLEGGLCSVYERRPVGCRSHMACGPAAWCATNRQHQIYPMAEETSIKSGQAIIEAHLKLGNVLHNDNMLALLANELLVYYPATASAEQIVFTETNEEKGQTNDKQEDNRPV